MRINTARGWLLRGEPARVSPPPSPAQPSGFQGAWNCSWGGGEDLISLQHKAHLCPVQESTGPVGRGARGPSLHSVTSGEPRPPRLLSHLHHRAQPRSARLTDVLKPQSSGSLWATIMSCVQGLRAPLDGDVGWAGWRASPRTDSHTQTGSLRPRGPGAG